MYTTQIPIVLQAIFCDNKSKLTRSSPMYKATAQALQQGHIIAYPTEGVYGLGCDPLNETAVMRLLALKQRPIEKGLILIASDWEQLQDFIQPLSEQRMQAIAKAENTTWLFEKTAHVPAWIAGAHNTIAVRVTTHPIAKAICDAYGAALISTSANISDQPAAMSTDEVKAIFAKDVDEIIAGEVGGLNKATMIRNAETDEILRH